MRIFSKETLRIETEEAERYLDAGPGNNFVKIIHGRRSDDSLESSSSLDFDEDFRLHLDDEPSATDPDA